MSIILIYINVNPEKSHGQYTDNDVAVKCACFHSHNTITLCIWRTVGSTHTCYKQLVHPVTAVTSSSVIILRMVYSFLYMRPLLMTSISSSIHSKVPSALDYCFLYRDVKAWGKNKKISGGGDFHPFFS